MRLNYQNYKLLCHNSDKKDEIMKTKTIMTKIKVGILRSKSQNYVILRHRYGIKGQNYKSWLKYNGKKGYYDNKNKINQNWNYEIKKSKLWDKNL